jgi:hypothetical protein
VDAPEPPLRLPLGADAYCRIELRLHQLSAEMAVWEDRAIATGFDD